MWRILLRSTWNLGVDLIQPTFVLPVNASVLEEAQCTRATQPVCLRCQHVSHRRVLTDGNFWWKVNHPRSEVPGRSRKLSTIMSLVPFITLSLP
ncbi:hypothetical protein ARMSODRAFT_228453 [Armillaria solidipes]|uniref:Uncharacterized protein n=1 Tax=Armillaria solidipes TaxID=1076256 RepID=A0A2H3CIB0_9AGAR|nr:hypothetical protein ARMSODRAFT_228453 [Armillaria solidipes]